MNIRFAQLFSLLFCAAQLLAQDVLKAPERTRGEGPFSQLIIRGATLINGNGAPPLGPVDIVIADNRIMEVTVVGQPGVEIPPGDRPTALDGAHEIDAHDMYVLPGFVDMHGHIGGGSQGAHAEYVFKLWLGHGITTIRDPSCGNGLAWVLDQKSKSEGNLITAPRILAYTAFGQGSEEPITSPAMARSWVQQNAQNGADGIKFFGTRPDIMEAALDENRKLGLRSACHHAQLNVAWLNAVQTATMGLTTMEHWYGLPEALFEDRTVQHYPADYNYMNEQHRFGEAGKLWQQAATSGSEKWEYVMQTLLELDFTLDPTFNIYEASRDLMRARRAEWHDEYTLPSLWEFYQPSKISHGSYWHYWGTEQEIDWKQNYRLWMQFVNEYKNRGGRVTAGSDSGFIFQLYGFGYIRELELLREAGFHPLEVIRAATLKGAEALGMEDRIGTVEVGKLADLIILEENPLINLKSLYGTGAIKLTDDNQVVRVGGVKYTIKDGIVFDAKALLQDVRNMVSDAKTKDNYRIYQPGRKNSP